MYTSLLSGLKALEKGRIDENLYAPTIAHKVPIKLSTKIRWATQAPRVRGPKRCIGFANCGLGYEHFSKTKQS